MAQRPATEEAAKFVEGVGGRLGAQKSPRFRRALQSVEARANMFVARAMLGSDLAYVISAVELGLTPRDDGRALEYVWTAVPPGAGIGCGATGAG